MGSDAASHIVAKCLPIEAALPANLGITLPKIFECFADGMVKVKRRGVFDGFVSGNAQVQILPCRILTSQC